MKFIAKQVNIASGPGMEVTITPDPRIAKERPEEVLKMWKLIRAALLLLAWAGGLVFAGRWLWGEVHAEIDLLEQLKYPTFVMLAAYWGAVGGWGITVLHVHRYVWEVVNVRNTNWNAPNNTFIKPLLWPLAAAAFGVAIPFLVFEVDTDPLRIAAFALAGGATWPNVANVLLGRIAAWMH